MEVNCSACTFDCCSESRLEFSIGFLVAIKYKSIAESSREGRAGSAVGVLLLSNLYIFLGIVISIC